MQIDFRVHAEGPRHGMRDRHFRQRQSDDQRDAARNQVSQNDARACLPHGNSRAQEEARADGAAQRDHAHLARGETAFQVVFARGNVARPTGDGHFRIRLRIVPAQDSAIVATGECGVN